MQKRWRVLLVIGFFLFSAAAAIYWATRKNHDASVSLVFLGYTNKLPSNTPATLYYPPAGKHFALLLATNNGSVSVELIAAWRPGFVGFVTPSGTGLPRVLAPGKSMIVYAAPGPGDVPWWTEYAYHRHGLRDKACNWLWNSTSGNTQKLLGYMLPDSSMTFVKCGPITNQPPTDVWWWPWDTVPSVEPRPSVRLLKSSLEDL